MKKLKNKVTTYRVHEYIRLFDFHKPLLSQMPVIMLIAMIFGMLFLAIPVIYSEGGH
tara:strand:- start:61 stop:231 length:171 start_codon:yes stop_codon:yes gene_type:complete